MPVDSTHLSTRSMEEDPHKKSSGRDQYSCSSKGCVSKYLQGRYITGDIFKGKCLWVMPDCHNNLLVKCGVWHASGKVLGLWERQLSLPNRHYFCPVSVPWGKMWGNSNRKAWQQDAWTICHVTKHLKLCELCRDSSHCQVLCVFLSVRDGKKLQILSCENSLASKHVISNWLFLSQC